MNGHPSVENAKQSAKRLRAQLSAEGKEVSHSRALEMVARQYGYRDWNTFCAAASCRPPKGWVVGGRVRGKYLAQPFTARVIAVTIQQPGWYKLTLDLDEAVDVVTFDSFSNFRKRITQVLGPMGTSREKTSDGCPHLELEL